MVIGSIVMAGMAYTVLRDRGGGEDGLILVVEGEEHNVYVENKTTLEAMKGMESAPYFELLFKPWNESECWEKAREFIPDLVLDEVDDGTYHFHSKNNSNIQLSVNKFFRIEYDNVEYRNQLLDREDLLAKQEYINKAIEVIKKYRGNISDLRLQTVDYPETETGGGEGEFLGYLPIVVVFRQYLYGMPVEGGIYGVVMVEFGRNMVLISYEDRTLPPERVFNRVNTGHVIPPKEMLVKIANREGGPRNIVVKSITLCLFAPGTPRIVRYNGGSPGMWVPMKYRVVIRPANGGTGQILYYDAI